MFCSYCGKDLPAEAVFCPKCGCRTQVECVNAESGGENTNNIGKSCPFCQTPIKPLEEIIVCPSCSTPHHKKCWELNENKCTTFGCCAQQETSNLRSESNTQTLTADSETVLKTKHSIREILKKPIYRMFIAVVLFAIIGAGYLYQSMNGEKTMSWSYGKNNSKQGTYQGKVSWNVPHGKGKLTEANGDYFEGDFRNGVFSGHGKFVSVFRTDAKGKYYKYQTEYIGTWKNGQRDGQGSETTWLWTDESQNFSGQPTLVEKFTGQFEKGLKKGYGKLVTSDTEYSGEWDEEKDYARVNSIETDGTTYNGEIKLLFLLPHGQGTMIYNDGGKYSGQWKQGKMEGWGTYTFPGGEKVVGQWTKGIPSDQGGKQYKIFLPNGKETTGSCWSTGNGGFECRWSLY